MKRNIGIGLLVLALVAAFSGLVMAQDQAADNMELVKEKIRADKKLFVAENMQLTEAQAKDFWPVYESYQADIEKQVMRTVKMIENFAKHHRAVSEDEATREAAAKEILDEWMAIQADDLKLRESYLPKFRKVLPEIKVSRYYQLESKIDAINRYVMAAKIPLFK